MPDVIQGLIIMEPSRFSECVHIGEVAKRIAGYIGDKLPPEFDMIVETFCKLPRHTTLHQIFTELESRGISYEAIKKTMDLLVKYGLVQKLHLESGDVYEPYMHGRHHIHYICVNCGRIYEDSDGDIDSVITNLARRKFGFTPFYSRVNVYGMCGECARHEREPVPLNYLSSGRSGIIESINGGKAVKNRLYAMGLKIGRRIEIVNNVGSVIIAIDGNRVAIGQGMAQKIRVRPIDIEDLKFQDKKSRSHGDSEITEE